MINDTNFSKTFLKITIPISLLLTVIAHDVLPEQYFRDSNYLNERSQSAVTGLKDPFEIIVRFYSVFKIINFPTILSLFQWLVFASLLLVARKINVRQSLVGDCISIFFLLLIPFYGSMLTKEFLVSCFFIILLIFQYVAPMKDVGRFFQYLVVLTIIGVSIRSYYFLTILVAVLLHLGFLMIRKTSFFILVLIIPSLATFDYKVGLFSKTTGADIFGVRMSVVNALPIKPRTTIFQDAYTVDLFSNIISYVKVLQQMFFPFSIATGSIYNLLTIVPILGLTVIFWLILRKIRRAKKLVPEFCIYLAYLIVATIFEPDLGSFLRHSFPYLPILIVGLHHHEATRGEVFLQQ